LQYTHWAKALSINYLYPCAKAQGNARKHKF
jgi:hypothetical protein